MADAGGPRIQYVNTTGYSNSVKIAWDEVPGADMYALTKSVGLNTSIVWVQGTTFIDTASPAGELARYSLMSNTATGGLSPPGRTVTVGNNRFIVESLKASLRSAESQAEVRLILLQYMARYFDRIFVGEDSVRLSSIDRAMLFAFFVAHNYAPYGPSDQFKLLELLHAQVLDCDNYAVFAGEMFHLMTNQRRLNSLEFIGFDGGPIGNHAQLLYTPDAGGEVWLVDPTVGIVASFASTEEMLSGGKSQQVRNYYAYYESDLQPADIPPWMLRIRDALKSGGYRQEQVIYRYPTLADYMKGWVLLTPGKE